MRARFRPRRQKTIKLLSVIVIIVVGVLLVLLTFVEVRAYGTGFAGKTLFDWLTLLGVLAVPIMVAIGGYWFNQIQKGREEFFARVQLETGQKMVEDNQREIALKEYIDKMSELILDKDNPIRKSKPEDEVRKIARIRTLTVLSRLDDRRKRVALQFLHESGLIEKDNRKIDLHDADLTGADLQDIRLTGTDLHGANLSGADLRRAYLTGMRLANVDLSEADLTDANLWGAELEDTDLTNANLTNAKLTNALVTLQQLDKAKSIKGATMPDGSIHP